MNRLKKLREEKGLKQSELAQMLNISQATLSNWEREVHDPDNENLRKLAQIFGCSTDFLLGYSSSFESERIDRAYFRIAQDAKNSGISPQDFQLALDFLKKAKERDENA